MHNDHIENALNVMTALIAADKRCEALNKAAQKYDPDFPPFCLKSISDSPLLDSILKLLTGIFGEEELAEYFYYEALNMKGGGASETPEGKWFPLRTVADLRKYALYLNKENGE